MGIWQFIQEQILGMKWLNEVIGFGLSALGLDVSGRIGGSIQFFLYDVVKITILLCFLILLSLIFRAFSRRSGADGFLGDFTVSGQISSLLCWER